MVTCALLLACAVACGDTAACGGQGGVYVPSPHEYLLEMAAHAAAWHAVLPAAGTEVSEQRRLVADAVRGECDGATLDRNWGLFVASREFLVSALARALVQETRESVAQLRLGDARCAEIRAIVDDAVRERSESLERIRREWACVATDEWWGQCVRPGAFFTREFMASRLLCGVPCRDAENDRRFYRLGDHALAHPAYLQRLADFVRGCCMDVWRDKGVVGGIAELVSGGVFCTKDIVMSGTGTREVMTVPSQETVDMICERMTSLYVDAILQRMNLPRLLWLLSFFL